MKSKAKYVTVRVTRYFITRGVKRSSGSCPIALAGDSATKKMQTFVAREHLKLRHDYGEKIMALPKKAQKFIEDFDSGKPVRPFSFRVRVG